MEALELSLLDVAEAEITQKLNQRLTDHGKAILYKELTGVLLKKQAIYKQQLQKYKEYGSSSSKTN